MNAIKGILLLIAFAPITLLGAHLIFIQNIQASTKAMGGLVVFLAMTGVGTLMGLVMVMKGVRERGLYDEQELSPEELAQWQDAYAQDQLPEWQLLQQELSQAPSTSISRQRA